MKLPFENWSPRAQRNAYWISMAATFAIAVVLQTMAAPFAASVPGEVMKYNIVNFELAGTLEKATVMMESWGPENCALAARQTLVDYGFLIAYPMTIALGILAVLKNTRSPRLWAVGRALAWLQFLAGALDAVENAALIALLKGSTSAVLPKVAFWCAAPKFAIVLAGILWVLIFAGLGYTRDAESGRA